MTSRPGWNYDTVEVLYQLWPPSEHNFGDWAASWTEHPDHELDENEEWMGEMDFLRAPTPEAALECFPPTAQAKQARRALLRACRT